MATLLFFDQGHKYTLDGEELPSVSELCRFLSREIYGDVAQWRLDNAADRGTAVHKACESLDKFGSVDVQDAILPYLQAYLKFRREHAVEWRKIEYASTTRSAATRAPLTVTASWTAYAPWWISRPAIQSIAPSVPPSSTSTAGCWMPRGFPWTSSLFCI